MYDSFCFLIIENLWIFFFKDEDEDYQSSLTNLKLKQYGPSADILQNIPNIDRVRPKKKRFV